MTTWIFSPDIFDGCHRDCLLVISAPVSLGEVERLPYPPQLTSTVHPVDQISYLKVTGTLFFTTKSYTLYMLTSHFSKVLDTDQR